MKKTNKNLIICAMVFVVALVISNVVSAKTITTGVVLFDTSITIPGAVFCYAITFLMTDIVGEIWGRKEARTIMLAGFGCQILATTLIVFTQFLPASDPNMQTAYETLLGPNVMLVTGSLVAYACSQSWDVFIFHRIRNFFMRRNDGSTRQRWIWNNASTMTAQAIDTVIFIGIGFGVGFGWLFDSSMLPTLLGMMLGQYIVKFLLALIDTPFFYFFTRGQHSPIQTNDLPSSLDEDARAEA